MALFREGTKPLWGAFVLAYVVAAIGLDLYWLFTESGPIAWLASLEARVMGGKWLPKLTFLVLLIGQIALLGIVKIVVEKITGRRLTAPVTPPRG